MYMAEVYTIFLSTYQLWSIQKLYVHILTIIGLTGWARYDQYAKIFVLVSLSCNIGHTIVEFPQNEQYICRMSLCLLFSSLLIVVCSKMTSC